MERGSDGQREPLASGSHLGHLGHDGQREPLASRTTSENVGHTADAHGGQEQLNDAPSTVTFTGAAEQTGQAGGLAITADRRVTMWLTSATG